MEVAEGETKEFLMSILNKKEKQQSNNKIEIVKKELDKIKDKIPSDKKEILIEANKELNQLEKEKNKKEFTRRLKKILNVLATLLPTPQAKAVQLVIALIADEDDCK